MLGFLEAPTILVTLIRHDQMPKAEPHAPLGFNWESWRGGGGDHYNVP